MARPPKQTVEYFPHVVNPDDGKTVRALFRELQTIWRNSGQT